MRICNYLLWLLLLFSFFSCTEKKPPRKSKLVTLSIKDVQLESSVRLSDIASLVECIPLETNNDLLISQITKVVSKANCLFLTDGKALYQFSEEGEALLKWQHAGLGPDEYINISDFQIDEKNNVWILSQSNKQLYKYNLKGALKEKIPLDCQVSKIYLMGSHNMSLYVGNNLEENNRFQLQLLDLRDGKVVDEFLPINSQKGKYLHIISRNSFVNSKKANDLYFFQAFNDTVYHLSAGQMSPAYFLELNGNNIPKSFFEAEYKDVMDFFQHLFKYSYAYGTNLFFENESHCFFSYYYNKECYMAMLAKTTPHKGVLFKGFLEDVCLFGYPISLTDLSVFLQSNGDLFLSLNPYDIMEYADTHLDNVEREKLSQQLHYKGEDQNPILLKIRMK